VSAGLFISGGLRGRGGGQWNRMPAINIKEAQRHKISLHTFKIIPALTHGVQYFFNEQILEILIFQARYGL
jgi:hypothetical protein